MKIGPLIATGRTAEVYAWDKDQVIKLFHNWVSEQGIKHEFDAARKWHDAGVNAPKAYKLIGEYGRLGIVFERIDGSTMLSMMISYPTQLADYAKILAELHLSIHKVETTEKPSYIDSIKYCINASTVFSQEIKNTALEQLERLEEGNSICHADFHPDNVIMSKKGPFVIDWANACVGNPMADVTRTKLMLMMGEPPEQEKLPPDFATMRDEFLKSYLDKYFENQTEELLNPDEWMLPVAVARSCENIEEEKD